MRQFHLFDFGHSNNKVNPCEPSVKVKRYKTEPIQTQTSTSQSQTTKRRVRRLQVQMPMNSCKPWQSKSSFKEMERENTPQADVDVEFAKHLNVKSYKSEHDVDNDRMEDTDVSESALKAQAASGLQRCATMSFIPRRNVSFSQAPADFMDMQGGKCDSIMDATNTRSNATQDHHLEQRQQPQRKLTKASSSLSLSARVLKKNLSLVLNNDNIRSRSAVDLASGSKDSNTCVSDPDFLVLSMSSSSGELRRHDSMRSNVSNGSFSSTNCSFVKQNIGNDQPGNGTMDISLHDLEAAEGFFHQSPTSASGHSTLSVEVGDEMQDFLQQGESLKRTVSFIKNHQLHVGNLTLDSTGLLVRNQPARRSMLTRCTTSAPNDNIVQKPLLRRHRSDSQLFATSNKPRSCDEYIEEPELSTFADDEFGCVVDMAVEDINSSSEIKVNLSIDDIKIGEKLGKGATSIVYQGIMKKTKEIVAVKVIKSAMQESRLSQILHEINSLQRIASANSACLLKFYGAFFSEGSATICIELMNRGSLENFYKRFGPVPERCLAGISFQVFSGLEFIHSLNLLHRDMKPGNILLNSLGEVKLTDFGICHEFSSMVLGGKTCSSPLCEGFVGSIRYMSPERIENKLYGRPSDIWSAGVCVLESAVGCYPFLMNVEEITRFDLIDLWMEESLPEALQLAKSEASLSRLFNEFIDSVLTIAPLSRAKPAELLRCEWFEHCDIIGLHDAKNNVKPWLQTVAREQ